MAKIYVSGHKNPDMDSICSAYAYAHLKNKVDPTNTYIPIRCGNLNEATRAQFNRFGISAPEFKRDVRTRVSKIIIEHDQAMCPTDPVYRLITLYEKTARLSVFPIMDGKRFIGLVTIDEISDFILKENVGSRPVYRFRVENFEHVIPGYFIKRGKEEVIRAPLAVGANKFATYEEVMQGFTGPLPILVVGDRERHINKAIDLNVPAIILTGLRDKTSSQIDWDRYEGSVYVSETDTAETLRLLRLCVPVSELLVQQLPALQADMLFDEARIFLANSDFRELPVFSGDTYRGYVSRRSFLEKPATKLIMVDHNENDQAISGVEEAEVVEIVDHHRLGAAKTRNPIFICCEPLGSTCTIVYKLFMRNNVEVTSQIAKVLLSGIVSDTIMLKSPTTTFEDYTAVQDLLSIAGVDDMYQFGETMFSGGATLAQSDARAMIEGDFKRYKESGVSFGIGQSEVTTLDDIEDYRARYLEELEMIKKAYNLDWALFLITDVVKENSLLLLTNMPIAEQKLTYEQSSEGVYLLPQVLSRKKQLLPEIIRVIQE
ncbi:MAG: putative manganese-dependent inorganic diphosphatase [Sphaerochaeta sp.]